MLITGRTVLLALSGLMTAVGIVLLAVEPSVWMWAAMIIAAGAVSMAVLLRFRPPQPPRNDESDDIRDVDDERCRELIRGTSLFLREMRYRYSVRFDRTERARFTMTVNNMRLGFVPVVINDNLSERQGYGYVAFIHDERRWRGPGLPCVGGPEQAVQYAAQCITPLDEQNRQSDDGVDNNDDDSDDGPPNNTP